jgi:hypothetical protein
LAAVGRVLGNSFEDGTGGLVECTVIGPADSVISRARRGLQFLLVSILIILCVIIGMDLSRRSADGPAACARIEL